MIGQSPFNLCRGASSKGAYPARMKQQHEHTHCQETGEKKRKGERTDREGGVSRGDSVGGRRQNREHGRGRTEREKRENINERKTTKNTWKRLKREMDREGGDSRGNSGGGRRKNRKHMRERTDK